MRNMQEMPRGDFLSSLRKEGELKDAQGQAEVLQRQLLSPLCSNKLLASIHFTSNCILISFSLLSTIFWNKKSFFVRTGLDSLRKKVNLSDAIIQVKISSSHNYDWLHWFNLLLVVHNGITVVSEWHIEGLMGKKTTSTELTILKSPHALAALVSTSNTPSTPVPTPPLCFCIHLWLRSLRCAYFWVWNRCFFTLSDLI